MFNRVTTVAAGLRDLERLEASAAYEASENASRSTRRLLLGGVVVALAFGLAVVAVLIGNLVPRIRQYSHFATGSPEPWNDMMAGAVLSKANNEAQAEFIDTLQMTASEEEAHELVQRHLERSLPGSGVVVLKRNNSANRLETATVLTTGNEIATRLLGAEPRACLAIRFTRTHREGTPRPPLLVCDVCTHSDRSSTCEPLLVGGEVIGSVLVSHPQLLGTDQTERIRTTVAQAAPVLANLRNLALAEFRANNDSLTGLPNKRATDDTLKRMVAQANRSITPLSAVMLDLDHFKQINDRFGHGKGDEVLAAAGAAMRSCLRTSDFAGRYGGEEFLILLPETTSDGAMQVAEKVRSAIASITVVGVERGITASLGVADLLQHAGNATGLLHEADKALYAAKAAGRNRTIVADSSDPESAPLLDGNLHSATSIK